MVTASAPPHPIATPLNWLHDYDLSKNTARGGKIKQSKGERGGREEVHLFGRGRGGVWRGLRPRWCSEGAEERCYLGDVAPSALLNGQSNANSWHSAGKTVGTAVAPARNQRRCAKKKKKVLSGRKESQCRSQRGRQSQGVGRGSYEGGPGGAQLFSVN